MNPITPEVKARFESPEWYLRGRRYNIEIRRETVQSFLAGRKPARILDIACGDGSLSIPLLTPANHLTLLDLSSAMLQAAKNHIPDALLPNVRFINEDFLRAGLQPHSFDLITCVGLFAHVDSPKEVIAKVASLLSPSGVVIAESTDAGHFLNRSSVMYQRILRSFGRDRYSLTLTTRHQIVDMFREQGLELSGLFRYTLSALVPRIERVLSQRALYRMVRVVYGSAGHNRNAWLGKECLYLFSPRPSQSSMKGSDLELVDATR